MCTIQEAYIELQRECNIEIGDAVKVIRKFRENELGSSCINWDYNQNKTNMQQGEYKVESLSKGYIGLKGEDRYTYSFPFFALELIEKYVEEKMIEIDGNEWSEATVKKAIQAYLDK